MVLVLTMTALAVAVMVVEVWAAAPQCCSRKKCHMMQHTMHRNTKMKMIIIMIIHASI